MEWSVAVGQAVKTDDVVALVETDKVTVDIKAEVDGVIVQQFGAVYVIDNFSVGFWQLGILTLTLLARDDTVEVGADLYVIDTEGVATVETSESSGAASATQPEPVKEEVPAAAAAATEAPSTSVPSHRQPSIAFLGKQGWANRLAGRDAVPQMLVPDKPNGTVVLDGSMIGASYGRPLFTEDEMEALVLGGANTAPSVVSMSSGAKFTA